MTDSANTTTERYMKKQNKTSPMSHRLPPDMKDKLQALADAERRSLTNYIELVLEDHIEKTERAKRRRSG